MEKIGLIMEINPFHNGHLYFLEQVKKKVNDAFLICVITTTTTQRGEISVLSKKVKTELLLKNGIDLVIELPFIMTNQGGEYYSYYNIKILNDLGVNKIYFGSETDNLKKIEEILKTNYTNDFEKGYLKQQLGNLKSNDILGISYVKAINKINPSIKYETIKRINNDYNDQTICSDSLVKICSATTIRCNLNESYIKNFLPLESFSNIMDINEKKLINLLVFQLLNNKNDDIFLSENGQLINKINKIFAKENIFKTINEYTLNDLANLCSDKNNSKYKFRRIFLNIIFQIKSEDVSKLINNNEYKILGFSRRYSQNIKNSSVLFHTYKNRDDMYCINDKIDKILSLYYNVDYMQNYKKPIIC